MNLFKEILFHSLIAAITLAAFIYFDSLGVSLKKVKELFPRNQEYYLVSNTEEPFSQIIDYENAKSLDKDEAYSGSGYGIIDGGGTYAQGFEYLIKKAYPDSLRKVSLSAYIKRIDDTPFEFVFVISIDNKSGENLYWDAVYTNEFDFPIGNWIQVNGEKIIPASADDPENTIKIYPWNKGQSTVNIDDFTITLGGQKERRGKEVKLNLVDNRNAIQESVIKRYSSISATSLGLQLNKDVTSSASSVSFDNSKNLVYSLDRELGTIVKSYLPWKENKTESIKLKLEKDSYPILLNSITYGMCLVNFSLPKQKIIIQTLENPVKVLKEISFQREGLNKSDLVQQLILFNPANNSDLYVTLNSDGLLQLLPLNQNGTETLVVKNLSEICNECSNSLISIIDPISQRTISLACLSNDQQFLYLLKPDKNGFKIEKINVDNNLDISNKSTLFSLNKSDYILFNNDWRFDLRKVTILDGEIKPLERIELNSKEPFAAPKYFESQELNISKTGDNNLLIIVSCKNKSNFQSKKIQMRNKIEYFNLEL